MPNNQPKEYNASIQKRLARIEETVADGATKSIPTFYCHPFVRLTFLCLSTHPGVLNVYQGSMDAAGDTVVWHYKSAIAIPASGGLDGGGAGGGIEVIGDYCRVDFVNSAGAAADVACSLFGRARS